MYRNHVASRASGQGGRAALLCCGVALVAAAQAGLAAGSGLRMVVLLGFVDLSLLLAPLLLRQAFVLLQVFVFLAPIGVFGYLSEGASTTILPLMGAGVAGLWMANVLIGRERPRPVRETRLLLAIGFLSVVSAILNVGRLHGYIPLLTHLQLLLFLYLVIQMVCSTASVRRLAWLVVLSQAGVAVANILALQGLLHVPGREIDINVTSGTTSLRSGGVSGGIDWVSAELLVSIVFAVNLLFIERRVGRRLALVACLAVMTTANVLTYSLGGWAALAIAIAVSLQRGSGARMSAVWKTIAIAAVVALALVRAVPGFQFRVQEKANQVATQSTDRWFSSRIGTARAGWRLMMANPAAGVGPGNSKYELPQHLSFSINNEYGAHNTYLEVGDELGIPGLLLFLALLLSSLAGLRRVLIEGQHGGAPPEELQLAKAVWAALIGLSLLSMVNGLERMKYLWLLMGLGVAIRLNSRERTVKGEPSSPVSSVSQL